MFEEEGFEIRPDYDRVNTIAAELEDSRACDATILLTHGDASVIATGLGDGSVIDLVLGGHTHKSILGETPWDMIYLEPSAKASAYTYAELWFTLEEESVRFERVANAHVVTVTDNISQLYDLPKNEEELDPQVFALSETAISAAESVNKEIGYITVDAVKYLNGQDNDGRDSTCGNWMASITARAVGADVGFINVGGIRTDLKIPKGQDRRYITAADLSAVFPFKNLIYCYEITYEDLLELLEYAVTGSGASLLSQMTGITCYYKDNKVESIVTDGGEAIYENGTWTVDPKETIRIALSEFIATTDRKEKDMSNPLISWNETDRLISTDVTDVEGALTVLTEEAAENDGYLYIDEGKHFVSLD